METDVPDIEKKVEEKRNKYNGKQWLTICVMASSDFLLSLCYTMQAPFYPKEAEKRGASATEYGFVFSIYALTGFVVSPTIGKCFHILGPKTSLNIGMIVTCISLFCFGFLDYVESHLPFICLSFFLRITEAIGSSTSSTASSAILSAQFPDTIGTLMGLIEGVVGVGVLLGPAVGELLFKLGGFQLPFITIATLLVLLDLFIFFVLPPIQKIDETGDRVKIWDVIKIPSVQIITLCTLVAAVNTSFVLPFLEPRIRKFNLTPLLTGLMFTIVGLCYTILSPFVGRICDEWLSPKTVLTLAMPMTIAGYIILGPTPHLGIPNNPTFCAIGLVVLGVTDAFSIVPTFTGLISSAVQAGYPNDVSTTGVVSGLWFSAYSLGSFLGPSISGYLNDKVGFEYATLFVIAINFAMFCGLTIFIGIEKGAFCCHKQQSTLLTVKTR